ncbi:MAG: phospholipid carrier-dependent glycosyltransferase [Candidatus Omnitrophica bacterium]|nr:phospholipid carrier-dependent glycosyltransferase [Candidatus Omnitrophota bacterium]
MDKRMIIFESHLINILLLILLSYVLFMFGNNLVSLTHPDEVFYAETAKEMIRHNNWLVPMIFDSPQFEKPIGFYFLLVLAIKLFGLTPFAIRFWPAIFAVFGVIAAYFISWLLFGKKRLSFLSGLILASSFIYLALSRAGLTDMVFSILVVISIGFFYLSYKDPGKRGLGIILSSVFCSLAVLTKGLLGISFLFGTAFIFLLYAKGFGFYLRNKIFYLAILLFAVLTVPWHLYMIKLYGASFIDIYWQNVHVERLFVSEHPKINTWYFYPGLMFAGVTPWLFLSLPAWYYFFKELIIEKKKELFFLLAWIAGVFIFVQPAQSKLSSYIFPVYPAIAIIIAFYLDKFLDNADKKEFLLPFKISGFLLSFVFLAGSLVVIFFSGKYPLIFPDKGPFYIVSLIFSIIGAILLIFNIARKYQALIFSHTLVTFAFLFILLMIRPQLEPWVSCKDVCDRFQEIDKSKSVVLASKFYVRGVRYYTDRSVAVMDIGGKGFYTPHPIPFLNTKDKILDFLSSQEITYAILKDGNVEDIKKILKDKPYTVEELYSIGGKYILRIEKIPVFKKYSV